MDHWSNPALKAYLAHHGIKGQRWGVRRYQNPDGTLTEKGKEGQRLDRQAQCEDYRESPEEICKRTGSICKGSVADSRCL